jgi:hypothetical protein
VVITARPPVIQPVQNPPHQFASWSILYPQLEKSLLAGNLLELDDDPIQPGRVHSKQHSALGVEIILDQNLAQQFVCLADPDRGVRRLTAGERRHDPRSAGDVDCFFDTLYSASVRS